MNFKSMYRNIELELLDCPFCGSEPKIKHIGNDHTKKIKIEIKCSKCRATKINGAIHYYFDWLEDISIEDWNTRVQNENR